MPSSDSSSPVEPPSLDKLERWMLDVITHPDGVETGLTEVPPEHQLAHNPDAARLETIVTRSKALSATERLQIYANMYLWRIVDILCDEYPTVRRIVGPERFYELSTGYITAHPSQHYDLAQMSVRFSSYLLHEVEVLEHREFIVEVAQLERSMEDAFDAPRVDSLDIDDLLGIAEDAWPQVRFVLMPALQLHEFEYPVNQFVQAYREDRHQDLPNPEQSWVAVYRGRDYRAWRCALRHEQYRLLRSLEQGQCLGEAITELAEDPEVDLSVLLPQLRTWFEQWASDGLFCEVHQ